MSARLCFPDGLLPSGRRWRAVCHCGYATTPRASTKLASDALLTEHGWTAGACAICEQSVPTRPWEVLRPLDDGIREIWVCRDVAACSERYQVLEAEARAQLAALYARAEA